MKGVSKIMSPDMLIITGFASWKIRVKLREMYLQKYHLNENRHFR